MSIVVDASVAAKYLIPESDTEKARVLFVEWQQGRVDLMAPEILPAEVASALWKRVRRGLASPGNATGLLDRFNQIELPLAPLDELVAPALKLALENRHTVYDGLYLALALETGSDFVTADARLHTLIASRFRQVHLLREWS